MTAVVTLRPGRRGKRHRLGRQYRLPTEADYQAVLRGQQRVVQKHWRSGKGTAKSNPGQCLMNQPRVGGGSGAGRAFSVQKYGMLQWGDLFTGRQKAALLELRKLTASRQTNKDGDKVGRVGGRLLSIGD